MFGKEMIPSYNFFSFILLSHRLLLPGVEGTGEVEDFHRREDPVDQSRSRHDSRNHEVVMEDMGEKRNERGL